MGCGEEGARTKSDKILRPKLLLSAALVALIVAAPTGDQASAQMQMMNVRPGFGGGGPVTGMGGLGGGRFNSGSQSFVPMAHVGPLAIGDGRNIGIIGRGDFRNTLGHLKASSFTRRITNRLRSLPGNACW